MKNEFLSAAILGAAMVIGFLAGFPIGSIAHNFVATSSDLEVALPQK